MVSAEDAPRDPWSRRERLLAVIAIVAVVGGTLGAVLGVVAKLQASDTSGRLDRVVAATAADGALAGFQGCRRSNAELRPALRTLPEVTKRLVVAALPALAASDPTLAAAFRSAPATLDATTRQLADQDCPSLYPAGYRVWVARGMPPAR